MGYIGGWNSQQKLNRICWNLGGEFCLRLFNFVSHQQREREERQRQNELISQQFLERIKERRLSLASPCVVVDIEKLLNSYDEDAGDDHEHEQDDEDYSRFFDGLNLAVAS